MADIVLGMGASHGPLLSTPPEQWDLRAEADRRNKSHWYRGKSYDYESLLKERAPGFAGEVTIDVRRERHGACRAAMEQLTQKFRQVAPEAVVIVGNDQREFFTEELTPSITVYRGKEIRNVQHHHDESSGLNVAEVGNAPEESATYPGDPELADHILRALAGENFDLAQSNTTPQNAIRHGIPHAFGFLYHSILGDAPPPSVPVILNVHYPHNQPKTERCLELGRAIHRAIKSFTGYKRVAMMASGGLTHFVVDEALDRKVLDAMSTGNEKALTEIPENIFKVGTAEIKNWFPVISAMNAEGRRYHQVGYVPCYRSEAGTGNAMAFVYWE
jgi:catalytic LigB subunit of aromatic ring-opening dioxygenase